LTPGGEQNAASGERQSRTGHFYEAVRKVVLSLIPFAECRTQYYLFDGDFFCIALESWQLGLMVPVQVTFACEASRAAWAQSAAFRLLQLVVTVVDPSLFTRVHWSWHCWATEGLAAKISVAINIILIMDLCLAKIWSDEVR
jgi:hypothetical protein